MEIRTARRLARLSLRQLAVRASTSHATLAAYEAGTKVPTVDTFDRVLRAAGFSVELALTRRIGGVDRADRGRELLAVLELAEQFPARGRGALAYPAFGR